MERAHAALSAGAAAEAEAALRLALDRACDARSAAGDDDAADRLATGIFVADVVADLAAGGLLADDDVRVATAVLSEVCEQPLANATFSLFLQVAASPRLAELPPLVAAEAHLGLLLHLGIATDVTLWLGRVGRVDCVLALGTDSISRRARAEARAAIGGRQPLVLLGRSTVCSRAVKRFGEPVGAVVVHTHPKATGAAAYLSEAARALGPLLEREALLERNTAHEQELVSAGEKRLMRIGFDLHDGPIQDVLALGTEVRHLRDQIDPFVVEEQRERAAGRFDDILGRLVEVDRTLRELAHSLESRSVVSRPLGETLHREADTFAERTGIAVRLEVRGDPDALTASQRLAVFRAIQESLANVRAHAGASSVEVSVRARRSRTDVRIVDDGQGFEVSRALARAAQRGRLGLVGIAERIRLLGGTFEVSSRPGGPTTLRLSLPRWEPFETIDGTGAAAKQK